MNAPFETPFKLRGRARARQRQTPPYRRTILFEALEPRLLLSADGASPAVADLLAAALVDADRQPASQRVQSTDAAPAPVLITISPDTTADVDLTAGTWIIELANGTRALQASGETDNVWRITGADEGTLNGQVFSGVGTLLGGADNQDTFILEPGGSLSGYVDGGPGGFDSLEIHGGDGTSAQFNASAPDSGSVVLGDQVIRYFGLEPINDNSVQAQKTVNGTAGVDHITIDDTGGDRLIVSSSPATFESVTLTRPSHLLTVNAGASDDVIDFDALFFSPALVIDGGAGNDTIDVSGRIVGMSVIKFSDGTAALVDGSSYVSVRNVETFTGFETTLIETGIPAWLEQGPGPITGGQTEGIANSPVVGAMQAIAAHPFNPNIIFAGTVNGGVWRTTDGGTTWSPLTDQFPSLSIGDITISPLDADNVAVSAATPLDKLVVYAGTGKFSSSAGEGGFNIGLLKSVNGGQSWSLQAANDLAGLSITAVVPTRLTESAQPVVLAAALDKTVLSRDANGFANQNQDGSLKYDVRREGGILRSVDGGATFSNKSEQLIGGAPDGPVSDLVADPADQNRFYAGIVGQGVYRSDDGGSGWTSVTAGLPGAAEAVRILLSVSGAQDPVTHNPPVYAALIHDTARLSAPVNLGLTPNQIQVDRVDIFEIGDAVQIANVNVGSGGNFDSTQWESTNAAGNAITVTAINRATNTLTLSANLQQPHAQDRLVRISAARASGVFRSDDLGATWNKLDFLGDADGTLNPGGQGLTNFALLADASSPTVVYASGDREARAAAAWPNTIGATNWTGRVFRGDSSQAAGAQWGAVVANGANGSAPHADSRELVFDARGNLLEGDDGGIYRLSNPSLAATATLQGNPNLNFADANPDTIVRAAGSWITDGFAAGQRITVANAGANNGSYTIAAITATTLTLSAEDALTAAGAANGITVTARRVWESSIGNLRTTEIRSLAYDPVNNVILIGNQDNGTAAQAPGLGMAVDVDGDGVPEDAATRFVWSQITQGDGNTQLAVPVDTNADGIVDRVSRFIMGNTFSTFRMEVWNAGIAPASTTNPVGLRSAVGQPARSGLTAADAGAGFSTIPYVANAVNPTRMLIGRAALYESTDQLNTITNIQGQGGNFLVTALAYGGNFQLTGNPSLSFANTNPDTITRSAGSWITDGFAAGQRITLSGAGANNGTFTVNAVSANTLTLAPAAALTAAVGVNNVKIGNADVIYAARFNKVFVRTTPGGPFTSTTIAGAGQITDIVMDSADWGTAYAVDSSKVYKTTDAGTTWTVVSDRLGVSNLRSLELVKTTNGHDALLVGSSSGVFRALDPTPGVQWTEFGRGLPNVLVSQIEFADPVAAADDLLLAGTLGRGAWSLVGDADTLLGQESVLRIDGTNADDVIFMQRSPGNASLLEVFVNNPISPTITLPLSTIDRIEINGLGGNDTVTVDSSDGAISVPGGVIFHGGDGGDTLILDGGKITSSQSQTVGDVTTLTVQDHASKAQQVVAYDAVETLTNNLPQASSLEKIGDAFGDFFRWIGLIAQPGQGADEEMAVLGTSLPRALAGTEVGGGVALSDLGDETPQDAGAAPEAESPAAEFGTSSEVEGFRRLIESGPDGFDLGDIGSAAMPTLEAFRSALDKVGDGVDDGDVSFTDVGGVITYHAQITKTLTGTADFGVAFSLFGGSVDLGGLIDVGADIALDLTFGFDSEGFFIQTTGSNPELAVQNITLDGTASAHGRFGFFDVDVSVDQFHVDNDVKFVVNLQDPGGDGKLRLSDLGLALGDKVDVSVSGSPTDDDIVLNASAHAEFGGVELGEAELTLTWADIAQPTSVGVSASAGFSQDLIDFLRVGPQQVLDQIAQIQQFADALQINVPVLQDGLDTIVGFINTFNEQVIQPLTNSASGTASFTSAQDLAERLAKGLGVDPDELGLAYDSTAKELTYHLNLAKSISTSASLDAGFDLPSGIADVSFSTDASIGGDFSFDTVIGIDLGAILDGRARPLVLPQRPHCQRHAERIGDRPGCDGAHRFPLDRHRRWLRRGAPDGRHHVERPRHARFRWAHRHRRAARCARRGLAHPLGLGGPLAADSRGCRARRLRRPEHRHGAPARRRSVQYRQLRRHVRRRLQQRLPVQRSHGRAAAEHDRAAHGPDRRAAPYRGAAGRPRPAGGRPGDRQDSRLRHLRPQQAAVRRRQRRRQAARRRGPADVHHGAGIRRAPGGHPRPRPVDHRRELRPGDQAAHVQPEPRRHAARREHAAEPRFRAGRGAGRFQHQRHREH